jgi:nitric-oxide synthase, bacterial
MTLLTGRFRRTLPQGDAADPAEAEEFIRMFYAETTGPGRVQDRVREVLTLIRRTGTYTHTAAELAFAARAAWRHSARCTGRLSWRTLRVRDRRGLASAAAVAGETIEHLRVATNGGRIRSCITVFAPDAPGQPGPRIWNSQVLSYAGYPAGGDPQNIRLTELATALGWRGPGGSFDLLPLIVQAAGQQPRVYPVPADAVLEVPISHPDFPWFAGLGLHWYAVPVISDMYLEAGGIRYPCAPFSGWYQADTEVGVRDLGDAGRYNVLPAVARGMGLDTSSVSTLWPDRAAVELAVAVKHSFRLAGVMATDHQAETRRFMRFIQAEEQAGRPWCADWAWIAPPIGASTTPVFHRAYPDQVLKPGFFHRREDLPAV